MSEHLCTETDTASCSSRSIGLCKPHVKSNQAMVHRGGRQGRSDRHCTVECRAYHSTLCVCHGAVGPCTYLYGRTVVDLVMRSRVLRTRSAVCTILLLLSGGQPHIFREADLHLRALVWLKTLALERPLAGTSTGRGIPGENPSPGPKKMPRGSVWREAVSALYSVWVDPAGIQ